MSLPKATGRVAGGITGMDAAGVVRNGRQLDSVAAKAGIRPDTWKQGNAKAQQRLLFTPEQ